MTDSAPRVLPGSARSLLVLLAALLPLLASGCAPAGALPGRQVEAAGEARHVVVISIDGLRPDAIQASGARTLQRLMREGAWTATARTVSPSKTLPSHTSMLTGVSPEVHGITWNFEQVGATGAVPVPTVFDLADAAGLRTAAFFGKAKFRHLIRPSAPAEVEAPRGSEIVLAPRITDQVVHHLRFHRPHLLFVHLADPDLAGHSVGWMSAPYRWAVRRADAAVGRILAAVRQSYGDDVVVIVTADHGGSGRDHGTESDEDSLIPWIAWGKGIEPGELHTRVATMDTAATILWALGIPVPSSWEGRPVTSAFAGAAIPFRAGGR